MVCRPLPRKDSAGLLTRCWEGSWVHLPPEYFPDKRLIGTGKGPNGSWKTDVQANQPRQTREDSVVWGQDLGSHM